MFAGYLDKLKIDPCEIVSLRFFSSTWNISLRLVSYIPDRITNFENICVVKNILAFNCKISSFYLPVVNRLQCRLSSVGQEARIAFKFRALFAIRVGPWYIFSEFMRLSSCSDRLNYQWSRRGSLTFLSFTKSKRSATFQGKSITRQRCR